MKAVAFSGSMFEPKHAKRIKSENGLKWSAIKILCDNLKKKLLSLFSNFENTNFEKNCSLISPIFGIKHRLPF